jgi:hypothetical protein
MTEFLPQRHQGTKKGKKLTFLSSLVPLCLGGENSLSELSRPGHILGGLTSPALRAEFEVKCG